MQLRPYQREANFALWEHFANDGSNALAWLPTGAGKTVLAEALIKAILHARPEAHILFVTHLTELIDQTRRRWEPTLGRMGIWCASLGKKEWKPITLASIQSLASLDDLPGVPDLVVIDECHAVPEDSESMYGQFIRKLPDTSQVLGLTATPWRLDGGEIFGPGKLFKAITVKVSMERLIKEGYLVTPRLAGSSTQTRIDTSKVKVTGGDYNLRDLSLAATKDDLVARQVSDALARMRDRTQAVWFCIDIAHATEVVGLLNLYEDGVRGCSGATIIHSELDKDRRAHNMAAFNQGSVRHIVNVNVLAEGWDCPGVQTVVLLRPTKSAARYVQMVGRGLRPDPHGFVPKDDCLVLDYAGIVAELGPITDPKVRTANTRKGQGEAPLKICDACYEYLPAACKVCPACGTAFPEAPRKGSDTPSGGDLLGMVKASRTLPVTKVTYAGHLSKSGNLCLRLTYHHSMAATTAEYLMFSYADAAAKARRVLSDLGCPNVAAITSVTDAIVELDAAATAGLLHPVTSITVVQDGKYDRVTARYVSKAVLSTSPA